MSSGLEEPRPEISLVALPSADAELVRRGVYGDNSGFSICLPVSLSGDPDILSTRILAGVPKANPL